MFRASGAKILSSDFLGAPAMRIERDEAVRGLITCIFLVIISVASIWLVTG
jgi:hypothetical protein